jgi:hypothetical protein
MSQTEVCTDLIPLYVRDEIAKAIDFAKTIVELNIQTDDEFEAAADQLARAKSFTKTLVDLRQCVVSPYKQKSTAIEAEFRPIIRSVDEAAAIITRSVGKYHQMLETKRRAEDAKRQAEAAEAQRKADEAARKELEKAQAYREQGREEMAQKAEARAEDKIELSQTMVAPVVEPKKVAGTTFKAKLVIGSVTDHKAAVEFLIRNPLTACLVTLDKAGIEKMKAMYGDVMTIPGIVFKEEISVISRSKRL